MFDVYLGETVAPYTTLEPLKALLPFKHDDTEIPTDENGIGGIQMGRLERRMRGRWQIVSRLWEKKRGDNSDLSLAAHLDYHRALSSQLEWQHHRADKPIRLALSKNATPTAALIQDDEALIDHALFWIACKNYQEADYLLAIINSDTLYEATKPLMSKGQFGPRNLNKKLWKLPIPEFDPANALHREIARAGEAAAAGAAHELAQLRRYLEDAGKPLTVASARKRLRNWLKTSKEGRAVELAVGRLLA